MFDEFLSHPYTIAYTKGRQFDWICLIFFLSILGELKLRGSALVGGRICSAVNAHGRHRPKILQDTSRLKTVVDKIFTPYISIRHHYAPNHFSIDLCLFSCKGCNRFGVIRYLASKRTGPGMIQSEVIAESLTCRCFWHHPAVFGIQEVLMGMYWHCLPCRGDLLDGSGEREMCGQDMIWYGVMGWSGETQ